jgi:hypothetical protein
MKHLPRQTKWSYVLMVFILSVLFGCKHEPVWPSGNPNPDPTDTTGNPTDTTQTDTTIVFHPCDPDTVYFERDLLPIFVSNCAKSNCHDAASAQDGVILDNYANIFRTGYIRPGRPDNSDLYEVITDDDPDKVMPPPPNTPLSSAEIAMIRKWIEQGAQDLSCGDSTIITGCQTADMSFSQDVQPILNTYCRGCHNSSGPSGGIDLSSHAGTLGPASSGQLYGAIAHQAGFAAMPQGGSKLSSCQIDKIKAWVDQGKKDN